MFGVHLSSVKKRITVHQTVRSMFGELTVLQTVQSMFVELLTVFPVKNGLNI